MEHVKYQRTKHLPWSQGIGSDDKVMRDLTHFDGRRVIVTEKMDGENTTLYADGIHARSLTYTPHPSRTWIKKFHASIAHLIPKDIRICGENMYAVHSIEYTALPSYFLVFGIYDKTTCLSWDDTEYFCKELGLTTVPVLFKGIFLNSDPQLPNRVFSHFTGVSQCGGEQEGYVIRLADSFRANETDWIVKWVRKDHVTTSEHWLNGEVKVNGLSKG